MRIDNDTIYHYTDYFALNGILKDGQLRMNNVLNMNDATEMIHFMCAIRDAVIERLNDKDKILALKDIFEQELKKEFSYSAYAACFSMFRDDASQWERYGNGGCGISIGFNRELLQSLIIEPISLQEVLYKDELDNHELIPAFLDIINKNEGFSSEDFSSVFHDAWIDSVVFKHSSFSSERELRLVVLPFTAALDIKPCYHVSKERIKKYYPLSLKDMCSVNNIQIDELITELIIGPESTQSLPILQDYLSDLGYDKLAKRVSLSECPLRRVIR